MLIDTRKLSNHEIVCTDVCIIGAGPAGTALAQEFLGSDVRVALLESGGRRGKRRIQKLSDGEISGDLDEPVKDTHLRQLGGTANHWIIKMSNQEYGYRYVPLSAIDFEQRKDVPYSGWPISRSDLDPYYERAHEVCEIGPFRYSPGEWETEEHKPLPLDPENVVSDFFTFGPTRIFTKGLPEKFARSQNIDTYIHATVVELLTDESGNTIETAVVRCFNGNEIHFKAKQFVIASGGYNTPRLLLASRSRFEHGIGNQHDVVGRYYMDHSLVPSGNLYLDDPRVINDMGLYDMRPIDGSSVLGKLSLSEDIMRREGLRNFCATVFPMPKVEDVYALLSLKEMVNNARRGMPQRQIFHHMKNIFKGRKHVARVLYQTLVYNSPLMPGFGQGGWSRHDDNHLKFNRVELLAFAEQSPHPDNRVTLLDEKDALGVPRIHVHFSWSEADLNSILRAQAIMAEELKKTGLGRFEPNIINGKPEIGSLGLHHLMGTTRMCEDPKYGVVDADCKVHGTSNLYIASSSVFPTGGYANPTLTIVALAIRVADELKQRLLGPVNTKESLKKSDVPAV